MIQPTPAVTRPYLWPRVVCQWECRLDEGVDGGLPEALIETTRGSSKFLSSTYQRTDLGNRRWATHHFHPPVPACVKGTTNPPLAASTWIGISTPVFS